MPDGSSGAGPTLASREAEECRDCVTRECCRRTWLSALTLAENVIVDEVYGRVQMGTPHDGVRECVLALRRLRGWRLAA